MHPRGRSSVVAKEMLLGNGGLAGDSEEQEQGATSVGARRRFGKPTRNSSTAPSIVDRNEK
jgi:hypothetical protein